MNEHFCNYEQASALKELGFNEECFTTYMNGVLQDDTFLFNHSIRTHETQNFVSRPTYSQAFRFFRENHDLPSEVRFVANLKIYDYRITKIDVKYTNAFYDGIRPTSAFHTYEEAESACLDKLIEIVNEKI